MNEAAKAFYYGTDPLTLYEYDTDSGPRYEISGMMYRYDLSFDEVERYFEGLWNCISNYK